MDVGTQQKPSGNKLYAPLSPGEIRVIKIHPASNPDDVVSCSLETTSLPRGLKYSALSYVWGLRVPADSITLNGITVPVTKNLGSALKRLRNLGVLDVNRKLSPGLVVPPEMSPPPKRPGKLSRISQRLLPTMFSPKEPLRLWVDALCINQDDIPERNHQVTQMALIYSNARQVISWLGEIDDDRLDLALNFVQRIYKNFGPYSKVDFTNPETINVRNGLKWILDNPDVCQFDPGTVAGNANWDSVFRLAKSTYWNRVWIIQEIAMARTLHDCVLLCGNVCASFAQYAALGIFLDELENTTPEDWPGADGVLRIHIIWHGNNLLNNLDQQIAAMRSNTFSPPMFLTAAEGHVATDPRDMVYGYQSVTNKPVVSVDYNKSVREVYLEWYQQVHYMDSLIDMSLPFTGIGLRSYINDHNLPSWLPDMTKYAASLRTGESVVPHGAPGIGQGLLSQAMAMQGHEDEIVHRLLPEDPSILEVSVLNFGTVEAVIAGTSALAWMPEHAHDALETLSELVRAFGVTVTYGIDSRASILCALYHAVQQGFDRFENRAISGLCLEESPGVELFLRGMRFSAENYRVPPFLFQSFDVSNGVALGVRFCKHTLSHLSVFDCEKKFPPCNPYNICTKSEVAKALLSNYVRWSSRFNACEDRSWFKTADGRLGIGPRNMKPGDQLVALDPSRLPVVLRRRGPNWVHVGTCYVAGLTATDVAELADKNNFKTEIIHLE